MTKTPSPESKLLDYHQLSKRTGRKVRSLRTFVKKGLVPYLRLGHRTVLFEPDKVLKALRRFEVKEI